jgi:protein phosphatase
MTDLSVCGEVPSQSVAGWKIRTRHAVVATETEYRGTGVRADRLAASPRHAGFASVTGCRSVNEDCVYANVDDGVFLVADGMGGHVGGAVASQLLADVIPPLLLHAIRNHDGQSSFVEQHIRQAVGSAQWAITERASREPRLAEMGSTIALGVVVDHTLYVTHVGDSRVYLVRQGAIKQITKDDSFVQALIDAGCVTAKEARRHPLRHVITQSVNAKRMAPVAIALHELQPGDRLLFATDGLTDVVEDEMLAWTLTHFDNPQFAANELVRQALDNGSRDNVTCLVVHIDAKCEDVF